MFILFLLSWPGQKFGKRFLFHLHPLANSVIMNTLTVHCRWEDEMVRERTGHPPSCTEAKKMKSLTPHAHGCSRANLRAALLYLYYCCYSGPICEMQRCAKMTFVFGSD